MPPPPPSVCPALACLGPAALRPLTEASNRPIVLLDQLTSARQVCVAGNRRTNKRTDGHRYRAMLPLLRREINNELYTALCIRRTLCKNVTIGTPMVIFAVLTVF